MQEDYERPSLSSADYEMLYSQLVREYRDLCRAHQLLQARAGKHLIQGGRLIHLLLLIHLIHLINLNIGLCLIHISLLRRGT